MVCTKGSGQLIFEKKSLRNPSTVLKNEIIDEIVQDIYEKGEHHDEAYFKNLWVTRGRLWNSFLYEFFTLNDIKDLHFVKSEVHKYCPVPDTPFEAPWLPLNASPTFGCLQRLNYLWTSLKKRLKSEKSCSQNQDTDDGLWPFEQLNTYIRVMQNIETREISDNLFLKASPSFSNNSIRHRSCLSLFPWSIFYSKDLEAFLDRLPGCLIYWNAHAFTTLLFEPTLWNSTCFWTPQDQHRALTAFMNAISPTMTTLHLACCSKLVSLPYCIQWIENVEPLLDLVMLSILWGISFESVHALCSHLLVYITREKYFLSTSLMKGKGLLLKNLYKKLSSVSWMESFKLLVALKQLCLQYVIFRQKFLDTQELLDDNNIQSYLSLREFITLSLTQRCHCILYQLAPYYLRKTIDKDNQMISVEFCGPSFRNVFWDIFIQPWIMYSMKATESWSCFERVVWQPFHQLDSLDEASLVEQFKIPSWASAPQSFGVLNVRTPCVDYLKKQLESHSTTSVQVVIFYYLKALLLPENFSTTLHSNFQSVIAVQTQPLAYRLEYFYGDLLEQNNLESNYRISSALLLDASMKNSPQSVSFNSNSISNVANIQSVFTLMGLEILNLQNECDSAIVFVKLLLHVMHSSFSFLPLQYYENLFSALLDRYSILHCADLNIPDSRCQRTLVMLWTSVSVRLMDYKQLISALHDLKRCVPDLSAMNSFSSNDFFNSNTNDGAISFLRRLFPLVYDSNQEDAIVNFFPLHKTLFSVETLRMLCKTSNLTVHPATRDFIQEWYNLSVASGEERHFLMKLEYLLCEFIHCALSKAKQFDFNTFTFAQEILCLYNPYVRFLPNKTLPKLLNEAYRLLYFCHGCLLLVNRGSNALKNVTSQDNILETSLDDTDTDSSCYLECSGKHQFLDPTWIAAHFSDPVLLIRKLVDCFPSLSHEQHWIMVEQIFEKIHNKETNILFGLKLVQILSLLHQNRFISAVRCFLHLSRALVNAVTSRKTLMSRWRNTSDQTYSFFLQRNVEKVRWYLIHQLVSSAECLAASNPFLISKSYTPGLFLRQAGILASQAQIDSFSSLVESHHTDVSESKKMLFMCPLLKCNEKIYEMHKKTNSQEVWERQLDIFQNQQVKFEDSRRDKKIEQSNPTSYYAQSAQKTFKVLSSAASSILSTPIGLTSNLGIHELSNSILLPFCNTSETHAPEPPFKPHQTTHPSLSEETFYNFQQVVNRTKIYKKHFEEDRNPHVTEFKLFDNREICSRKPLQGSTVSHRLHHENEGNDQSDLLSAYSLSSSQNKSLNNSVSDLLTCETKIKKNDQNDFVANDTKLDSAETFHSSTLLKQNSNNPLVIPQDSASQTLINYPISYQFSPIPETHEFSSSPQSKPPLQATSSTTISNIKPLLHQVPEIEKIFLTNNQYENTVKTSPVKISSTLDKINAKLMENPEVEKDHFKAYPNLKQIYGSACQNLGFSLFPLNATMTFFKGSSSHSSNEPSEIGDNPLTQDIYHLDSFPDPHIHQHPVKVPASELAITRVDNFANTTAVKRKCSDHFMIDNNISDKESDVEQYTDDVNECFHYLSRSESFHTKLVLELNPNQVSDVSSVESNQSNKDKSYDTYKESDMQLKSILCFTKKDIPSKHSKAKTFFSNSLSNNSHISSEKCPIKVSEHFYNDLNPNAGDWKDFIAFSQDTYASKVSSLTRPSYPSSVANPDMPQNIYAWEEDLLLDGLDIDEEAEAYEPLILSRSSCQNNIHNEGEAHQMHVAKQSSHNLNVPTSQTTLQELAVQPIDIIDGWDDDLHISENASLDENESCHGVQLHNTITYLSSPKKGKRNHIEKTAFSRHTLRIQHNADPLQATMLRQGKINFSNTSCVSLCKTNSDHVATCLRKENNGIIAWKKKGLHSNEQCNKFVPSCHPMVCEKSEDSFCTELEKNEWDDEISVCDSMLNE